MAGPADLVPAVSFAGWRFDQNESKKVTNDLPTAAAAGDALKAHARSLGLSGANVDFYLVRETTTYLPLSKTRFTIVTTTEPYVP